MLGQIETAPAAVAVRRSSEEALGEAKSAVSQYRALIRWLWIATFAIPLALWTLAAGSPLLVVIAIGATAALPLAARRLLAIERPEPWARHVEVDQHRAPGLHVIVREVADRLGAPMPDRVCVSSHAVVTTERSGGGLQLQVGCGLLAVATESELRALVAHAIAMRQNPDSGDADRVVSDIDAMRRRVRGLDDGEGTGWLARSIDGLASRAESALREYFDSESLRADGVAARVYGPDALSAAIAREQSAAVRWRETPVCDLLIHCRVGDVIEWAAERFADRDDAEGRRSTNDGRVIDGGGRSFYPSPSVRLSALGPERAASDGASARFLVSYPDTVFAELAAAIDAADADRERRACRARLREARRMRAQARPRAQIWGTGFFGAFFVLTGIGLLVSKSQPVVGWSCVSVGVPLGLNCVWLCRPMRRSAIPVPGFDCATAAIDAPPWAGPGAEWVTPIRSRFASDSLASDGSRPDGVRQWREICRGAVASWDYRTGWVAAVASLEAGDRSPVGQATLEWSGGCMKDALGRLSPLDAPCDINCGEVEDGRQSLEYALTLVPLESGLAYMANRDWDKAEPELLQEAGRSCRDADFLALLGLCQRKAGHPREGVARLREALARAPGRPRIRACLCDTLTEMGRLDEAVSEALSAAEPTIVDRDLLLALVRANALLTKASEAERWAWLMLDGDRSPAVYLDLGMTYYRVGMTDSAERYLELARDRGFHPRACMELARLAADRGDAVRSRELLLSSVDMTQTALPGAEPAIYVLSDAFEGLLRLAPDPCRCRAWWAPVQLSGSIPRKGAMRLLVLAVGETDALAYVQELHDAMFPDRADALDASSLIEVRRPELLNAWMSPGVYGCRVGDRQAAEPDAAQSSDDGTGWIGSRLPDWLRSASWKALDAVGSRL